MSRRGRGGGAGYKAVWLIGGIAYLALGGSSSSGGSMGGAYQQGRDDCAADVVKAKQLELLPACVLPPWKEGKAEMEKAAPDYWAVHFAEVRSRHPKSPTDDPEYRRGYLDRMEEFWEARRAQCDEKSKLAGGELAGPMELQKILSQLVS